MDETENYYLKSKKPVTKDHLYDYLYAMSIISKSIETI